MAGLHHSGANTGLMDDWYMPPATLEGTRSRRREGDHVARVLESHGVTEQQAVVPNNGLQVNLDLRDASYPHHPLGNLDGVPTHPHLGEDGEADHEGSLKVLDPLLQGLVLTNERMATKKNRPRRVNAERAKSPH